MLILVCFPSSCLSWISLYSSFYMEPPNISISAHMLAQWVAIKDYSHAVPTRSLKNSGWSTDYNRKVL